MFFYILFYFSKMTFFYDFSFSLRQILLSKSKQHTVKNRIYHHHFAEYQIIFLTLTFLKRRHIIVYSSCGWHNDKYHIGHRKNGLRAAWGLCAT